MDFPLDDAFVELLLPGAIRCSNSSILRFRFFTIFHLPFFKIEPILASASAYVLQVRAKGVNSEDSRNAKEKYLVDVTLLHAQ